ncbi:MAG: hypothetical protein MI923_11770 [Phycisphaerales bacterium]|nr:hypothetical protein [Phycisphaerales bacterium]
MIDDVRWVTSSTKKEPPRVYSGMHARHDDSCEKCLVGQSHPIPNDFWGAFPNSKQHQGLQNLTRVVDRVARWLLIRVVN